MKKMKAARIFGENDIRLVEIPVPEVNDDEVLVRVKAVGLCGTDVELFEGSMPYLRMGLTTLPITPGHEWSGVVEETGKNVAKYKAGDRVTGDVSIGCGECSYCKKGRFNLCVDRKEVGSYKNKDGGFAEYIVMPEKHLYHIPDKLSLPEAAMIEPAATSAYGAIRTGIDFGSTVLVIGDGPIGQLAVQCADVGGAAKVILSGSYDEKLSIAEGYGADITINRHKENVVEAVKKYTAGEGADIVIESCGKEAGLTQAIECVKPGGKITLLSIYPQEKVSIDLNSVIVADVNTYGILASPNAFQPVINMMEADKIKTKNLITHTLPLEEAEKAFELVYKERKNVIKIILTP